VDAFCGRLDIQRYAFRNPAPETGPTNILLPFHIIQLIYVETAVNLYLPLSFSCVSVALTISDFVALQKVYCLAFSDEVLICLLSFDIGKSALSVDHSICVWPGLVQI
jgi:hypothetical protein